MINEGKRMPAKRELTLRNFGLKVGMVGQVRFEARIQELVENTPDLAVTGGAAAHRPAGAP